MRRVTLNAACPTVGQEDRIAWLTRHLEARLRDFGPGGPEVLQADQKRGTVTARFPGHDTQTILNQLEQHGISAALEGDRVRFHLSPKVRFEDLDYLWGCLFNLL